MLTNDDLDDIQERIDAYMQPGSRLLTNGINNDEAVELVKMARRSAELESALRGLSDMYSHAWDLVEGGLLMMGPSIPRFEEAHQKARIALGHPPLIDIDDEDDSAINSQRKEAKE